MGKEEVERATAGGLGARGGREPHRMESGPGGQRKRVQPACSSPASQGLSPCHPSVCAWQQVTGPIACDGSE